MDAAAVVEPNKPATLTEGVVEPKGYAKTSAVKEDTIVNRETKLALLIGFVAIVVVTVLVGEHFGKARNAAPATTDMGTSAAAAPSTTGLTVDPITASPVSTPSAPLTQPIGVGSPAPVQPVELTTTGPAVAGAGTTGRAPQTGNPNVFMPAAGVDSTIIPSGAGATGVGEIPGTRAVNTLGGATPPGFEVPQNTKPVSTGVEKMHPVAKGETLNTLAQRYYGDKSFSKELASYNAKRLSANGTVREGVTLRIPPKDVLLGDAELAGNATGRTDFTPSSFKPEAAKPQAKATVKPKAADKPKATEKPKATGPRTYVIKKGDTLMSIASKELGSAKRWESLLVANPSVDENSLRAGMTIKIPAK